jgi:hypothetical protein
MELPFLTVNYDTLTNDDYTTQNQRYEYEQCYHPTEREIKKSLYFMTYSHTYIAVFVIINNNYHYFSTDYFKKKPGENMRFH